MHRDSSETQAKFVRHDGGERLFILGETMRVLADSTDTGGQFTLVHLDTPPGAGPPPHRHTLEDETFYVLEGTVQITLEGEPPMTLTAGDFAFAPRGIRHRFQNTGERPLKMLVLVAPGGLERFFRAVSAEIGHNLPPDMAVLTRLAKDAGLEIE